MRKILISGMFAILTFTGQSRSELVTDVDGVAGEFQAL